MIARFVVVAVDGWPIKPLPVRASWRGTMLSVSVLDRAYCYAEVARFNQEDVRGGGGKKREGGTGNRMTTEQRRESIRNRAAGLAAMLNAEWEAERSDA